MKLSTKLYVMGHAGLWVAMTGAVFAIVGLALQYSDLATHPAKILMTLGGIFCFGGFGYHVVAGDTHPMPGEVKRVLDTLDAAEKKKHRGSQ